MLTQKKKRQCTHIHRNFEKCFDNMKPFNSKLVYFIIKFFLSNLYFVDNCKTPKKNYYFD